MEGLRDGGSRNVHERRGTRRRRRRAWIGSLDRVFEGSGVDLKARGVRREWGDLGAKFEVARRLGNVR